MLAEKLKTENYIEKLINIGEKRNFDSKTLEFLENLYPNLGEKSYISVLKKFRELGNTYRFGTRWGVNDLDKLSFLIGENDIYITLNTFLAPHLRTDKFLHKLNALYVDLDYYQNEDLKDLSPSQVVGLIEEEVNFPRPSYYISSGCGLYIIFLLEDTNASRRAKKFWRKLEEELISRFEGFGVDKSVKDPTRVLRLPQTAHSFSHKEVKIIESTLYKELEEPVRYTLRSLSEFFWGTERTKEEIETDKKEKRKERLEKKLKTKNYVKLSNKLVKIQNYYTLNKARQEDIQKIVELREGNVTGYREIILFLYRLHLGYTDYVSDEDVFAQQVLSLNSTFTEPLMEREALQATYSAITSSKIYFSLQQEFRKQGRKKDIGTFLKEKGGCYLYKNSTIIDLLEITAEEQQELKVLINQVEKNRRRRIKYAENKEFYERKNKKDYEKVAKKNTEEKEKRNKKIQELLKKGHSKKDIAKILNISYSGLKKILKSVV